MSPYLLLAIARHVLGLEYWTPPDTYWVAYFNDGTEISGGSYARQQVTWADPAALSDTQVQAESSSAVIFENLPATDIDELRIMDAATGGNSLFITTHLRTFTAGDAKAYPAGAIDQLFERVTA